MATKRSGGKITGLLAIGFESALALDIGDPVMVVGPYEVALCNGSKPCVGVVSVRNVGRGPNGEFPVDNPGGDVTVEMRGFYVRPVLSGTAIAAGVTVGYNAAAALIPVGSGGVVEGTNEVQTVTEGGAGLTSFTLTFSGQTTAPIPAAATAAQVQAALEALSNINPGDVTVTGAASGPYTVTFSGQYAGTNPAQMTATPTGGTGTVTVATATGGVASTVSAVGITLMPATAAGQTIDVLFR